MMTDRSAAGGNAKGEEDEEPGGAEKIAIRLDYRAARDCRCRYRPSCDRQPPFSASASLRRMIASVDLI